MKTKMMTTATKATAAILMAATVMSTAAPVVVRADEINPQATECVETNEAAPAETVVETPVEQATSGTEAQPVAETVTEALVVEIPAAPEVEGQGDIIDDQFAVAPEAEAQPVAETVTEAPVVEIPAAPEVEGQGDIIDDQFAVAPEAEAQPATETVVEAPVAKAQPQTVNGTYEDDPELSEEDKSEETKKLEEIYKSLFPVKKTLHADDETLDKAIEEGMSGNPDKAFVESTKELAKLIANTVDAQATDAACPFMGQFQNLVKQRLLLSKANDAKTPELKAKYMREAQEAAEDNLMESIMPGVAGLQTVVDAGKIVVKQAFGEKGKQIFGDLCDTSKEYAPCFGTLAISNRANDLLRKANEAKTPEMKGKYLKEYEKACTKLKFSYFPGGAAVYDLFTKVPKWFA